jgi:hypothetical protein
MLAIFVVLIVYCVASAFVLSDQQPVGVPTGRCRDCHYDLVGLPLESVCPECGSAEKEVKTGWSAVSPQRKARWIPTLILSGLTVVFAYPLAEGVLVLSYLHDHFGIETALKAMQNRELSDHGEGIGGVLFPLLCTAAFSPLTALFQSRRAAGWWLVSVMGSGLLITLALWTICQPGYK